MLALFKDPAPLMLAPPAIEWARLQWRRSLDKGHVPTSSFLQIEWRKEYAELDYPLDEIEAWSGHVQGAWLAELLAQSDVREIFAHGPQLVEAVGEGRWQVLVPLDPIDWALWLETFAVTLGSEFNFTRPCTSTHWNHQGIPWRITLLHGSLSPENTPKAFLRRLSATPRALPDYGLDPAAVELVNGFVGNRENMLVAGATGSGKTSFLASVLAQAENDDHIVVLEDTQEISCEAPRFTRLLGSDRPGRSLSELLAHTLRLSPDRIVLGEMRSHEVVPFLLAMNTGHKGVMGTLHASSAVDAIHRVAQLFTLASNHKEMDYREVLKLVAKNVGVVVFLEKRRVTEVIRVYGCEEGQPLYDVIWAMS